MSAVVEALSFLGPHGTVARDVESRICYDSRHAAGVSATRVRSHCESG